MLHTMQALQNYTWATIILCHANIHLINYMHFHAFIKLLHFHQFFSFLFIFSKKLDNHQNIAQLLHSRFSHSHTPPNLFTGLAQESTTYLPIPPQIQPAIHSEPPWSIPRSPQPANLANFPALPSVNLVSLAAAEILNDYQAA